ncbi:MAG: RagB/SusD family nutrient uptake outer membrane protein [Bacteroidales bacterium]|nr:RagB/SusD family nutrient uptake outer membrane protein [Bacteroidales bacterium]
MKNIFKYTAFVAGLALLCVSCTDKLTIPPVGSLSSDGYFSTPSHIEEGIRGAYAKLLSIETDEYSYLSETRSDNIFADPAPNATREATEIGHYRFNESQGQLKNVWAGWYSVIYNANNVLANLENVEFTNEAVKNQFRGELLFLRAYAHFELVRVFGNVPVIDHVLSASEAKEIPQTAGKDVLTGTVIPDLKEAIGLLPYQSSMLSNSGGSATSEYRGDKLAAQAMLARVYMTLYGWPYNDSSVKGEAKSLLKTVIDYATANGYYAPDATEWKKMFTTDRATQNKYFIFSFQHTDATSTGLAFVTCAEALTVDYLPTQVTNSRYNGNSMYTGYVEATLRYEYQETGDERGAFCILDTMAPVGLYTGYPNRETEFTLDSGEKITAYERSVNTKWVPYAAKRESVGVSFDDTSLSTGWPMNFPIIRTEDMMLLYAELLAEDGDVSGAMEIVNKIRTRAGVEARPTDCSAADALNYVKKERKLEFFGEGIRWFDEIRYGEWKDVTVKMLNRYINSSNPGYATTVSTVSVVDGKYLCPIPESEMLSVPGLYTQNSGW